jgi:class 3 adenylate cyclase
MILPLETITTIIQTFVQEMTVVVANNYGYVLKYIGDAITAYFPVTNETGFHTYYKRALLCAIDMLITVVHGVNTIFKEFDFPELHIKIGID